MSVQQARVPIPASDQTWLHMDRPNNLMHVHSLMWFGAEAPTWEAVLELVQRVIIDRFPVFHRLAVEDGQWFWEDDPDFELTYHVRRTTLPGAGDVDDLRDYIGRRFADPFDHGRPLWTMEVIPGVTGLADDPRTVIFSRFHHSLADGIRLVQLLLSLCETTESAAHPPAVGRAPGGGA